MKPLLGLGVAIALASRVVTGLSYSDVKDLKTWKISDPKVMCKDATFNTPEEALRLWYAVGADIQLDNWVQNRGYKNWFNNMVAFAQNASGDMVCSSVTGGQCNIGADDCYKLVAQGKGQFYWILKAVSIFHASIANMYTRYVQDNAVSASLHAGTIIKDFNITPPPPSIIPNWLSQLAGAMTMGGAIASLAGWSWGSLPVSGVFSLLGGILSQTAKLHKPVKPQLQEVDLDEEIGAYFDEVGNTMQHLLWNVLGVGDQVNPADQNAIPSYMRTEDHKCKTPVCQFFSDGKFLIMDPALNMDPSIQNGKQLFKQALAFDCLGEQKFWLNIYNTATDVNEQVCNEYRHGKSGTKTKGDPNVRWIASKKRCVTMAIPNMPYEEYKEDYCETLVPLGGLAGHGGKHCGTRKVAWPTNFNETLTDTLINTYKVNLDAVYESALDCWLNSKTGDIDTSAIPLHGTARCFFHPPVRFGSLAGEEGSYYWQGSEGGQIPRPYRSYRYGGSRGPSCLVLKFTNAGKKSKPAHTQTQIHSWSSDPEGVRKIRGWSNHGRDIGDLRRTG
ncbi:hypothetical protein F4810DRAFT_718246 [Camillea tinctor]|nr:hypothetical protein F4810DRAFT_718246 [Camillea tinctor]